MKGPEARPAPQTRALRPGPQESGCWVFERQESGRRPRRPPSRSEPRVPSASSARPLWDRGQGDRG